MAQSVTTETPSIDVAPLVAALEELHGLSLRHPELGRRLAHMARQGEPLVETAAAGDGLRLMPSAFLRGFLAAAEDAL